MVSLLCPPSLTYLNSPVCFYFLWKRNVSSKFNHSTISHPGGEILLLPTILWWCLGTMSQGGKTEAKKDIKINDLLFYYIPFLSQPANFLCRSFLWLLLNFQSCLSWATGKEQKGAGLETTAISCGQSSPGWPIDLHCFLLDKETSQPQIKQLNKGLFGRMLWRYFFIPFNHYLQFLSIYVPRWKDFVSTEKGHPGFIP